MNPLVKVKVKVSAKSILDLSYELQCKLLEKWHQDYLRTRNWWWRFRNKTPPFVVTSHWRMILKEIVDGDWDSIEDLSEGSYLIERLICTKY